VKVEISPEAIWGNLSGWKYKVDQDFMPEWFDADDCEKRTRKELKNRIGIKLLNNLKLLDDFLLEIKTIKWLRQHWTPLKLWNISEGKNLAAAGAAARDAAGAAARDAGLKAQSIICTGLKIEPKHIKHINERWDVWKRGYALLCDVNGKLFVYAVKK
jgi:hypothetical protein